MANSNQPAKNPDEPGEPIVILWPDGQFETGEGVTIPKWVHVTYTDDLEADILWYNKTVGYRDKKDM